MNGLSDQASGTATAIARLKGATSLIVLASGLAAAPALAQDQTAVAVTGEASAAASQPADQQAPIEAQDEGEVIVVTGFRGSLNAALNVKRQSVSAVDAIVAEDIAKFPDQNLAEALQRIPGISIQRDGGEGRAITVRGLGSQFTRVRVNGMETVATTTDGQSVNRDRAFDFNVFASELFSSVVVHKTAEASLDEGSLGAVVDLNTGNPLGNKKGLTFVGNAQATYNDLSKNWGPRFAGLLGWKNDEGTLAASVSAAYQHTDNDELGNNSVRWEQARFDSVNGLPCWYNTSGSGPTLAYTTPRTNVAGSSNSGGTFNPGGAGGLCGDVGLAFHPRIPRYGEVGHDRKRLGITGSIQFEPTDRTKVSVDALYSDFKEAREEKWGEVLFRSNQRRIDVIDPVIDEDNNMVSGTFNDAWVRTEHYLRKSDTKFYQVGASWDQDLTDNFRFTLLGGVSKSDADIPVETTMIFDNRNAQGYEYDYSDMSSPRLTFGTSMTNPANFQLAEIRDRPSNVTNKFRTAQLRTEWDVTDGFQLKAGIVYRRFSFDSEAFTRDTAVCGATANTPDLVLGGPANGGVTCTASVYGFPVTDAMADLFELGHAGQPGGTTEEWLIPNLDATTDFTGLYDRTAIVDAGNTRSVTEKVTGGYFQTDFKGELAGVRYAANFGMRYVHTDQSSTGISSGGGITVKRTYDDWLPAFNLAVYPTQNLIFRAAIAKVMNRPTLGQLTPGGTADGFNFRITSGNPFLEPFRATTYDLGIEWYFAPQSIFSVALFRKDIESFPVGQTISGISFDETGLPVSALVPSSPAALDPALRAAPIWTFNTTINGEGAKLKGVEIGLQGPFRFLPGFLKNFGGIANVTLVDSSATYTVTGARTGYCTIALVQSGGCTQANLGTFMPQASESRKATFFGLSKKAFNGTLYYDDGTLSVRGSVSYRSGFNDQNSATGNIFEGYKSTINVDAALRYKINDHIELSVDGINLTDEYRARWTDIDTKRNYENNHFGRTFIVGASYRL